MKLPLVAITLVGAALTGAVTLASCDEGSGAYVAAAGPAPRLLASSLDSYPKGAGGDATKVKLRPLLVLRFDRPMSPTSASRANYQITSGRVGSVSFLTPRVDPVERTVVIALDRSLLPQTQYELHIRSAPDIANRLAAYDGAMFVGETVLRFTTEDSAAPGEREELDPDPVKLSDPCEAVSILQAGCTGSLCHGGEKPVAPALGLSFATDEAIEKTAVGHASLLAQEPGAPAGVGAAVVRRFPYGMPIISRGSAASSFLLYKILLQAPTGVPVAQPDSLAVPDVADPGQRVAADLRTRVPGAPMPHPERISEPGQPPSALRRPLSWGEVSKLRAWIDQGAKACTAPPVAAGDAGAMDGGASGAGGAGGGDSGADASGDTGPPDVAGDAGRADARDGGARG